MARIDLKSVSDAFYRDVCSATLKPVQNSLVVARSMGVHVEVVNLVIPTLNDKPEEESREDGKEDAAGQGEVDPPISAATRDSPNCCGPRHTA